MKKYLLLVVSLMSVHLLYAQQSFDSSFPFETDPAKKFSIYLPSSYTASGPNKLMVAFHPFNVGTWNAKTWRDELISFAEDAGVILLCPDGGSDGRVDDPIDYRFTTALIDSAKNWYVIEDKGIFAMGFSVGGKAMYEYGLENASVFSGFIPIGAAINGTTEVNDVISNALCKPFYIVHGENDSPSVRYEPIKAALEQKKALVNYILMAGVGHTINFPNRESVLKTAFQWIDTVKCKYSTGINVTSAPEAFRLFPTMVSAGTGTLYLDIQLKTPEILSIEIWSIDGRRIYSEQNSYKSGRKSIPVGNLTGGAYLLNVSGNGYNYSHKFLID